MTSAIPAATLVLMRDRVATPPELLMVERAAAMAFAGGALVFPGGRVDDADRALALDYDIADMADAAARIAAIRETLEETGIAVAMDPAPDAAEVLPMRRGLHRGESLAALLGDRRLSLDLLVPFARWLPAHATMRIFDTRFYIAALPPGAGEPLADAGETVAAHWASAAETLAAADAGEALVIFPTRRNLERLAPLTDFKAAVAECAAHPQTIVTPWVETRGGVEHLCIPEGLGYPVTAEPLTNAMRG